MEASTGAYIAAHLAGVVIFMNYYLDLGAGTGAREAASLSGLALLGILSIIIMTGLFMLYLVFAVLGAREQNANQTLAKFLIFMPFLTPLIILNLIMASVIWYGLIKKQKAAFSEYIKAIEKEQDKK